MEDLPFGYCAYHIIGEEILAHLTWVSPQMGVNGGFHLTMFSWRLEGGKMKTLKFIHRDGDSSQHISSYSYLVRKSPFTQGQYFVLYR